MEIEFLYDKIRNLEAEVSQLKLALAEALEAIDCEYQRRAVYLRSKKPVRTF